MSAPPRISLAFVCVLLYFAAAAGGGAAALQLTIPIWTPGFEGSRLTVAEALALAAALGAVADGALRPPIGRLDRLLSVLAFAVSVAAIYSAKDLLTPGYGILLALTFGDALAAACAPLRDDALG